MIRYSLQEGVADSLGRRMRSVEVVTEARHLVGRVVRGTLDGCERSGTFRFEPLTGPATTLGVDTAGWRGKVARVVAPRYRAVQGERSAELKDRLGENLLGFAVSGTVEGRPISATEGWSGAVSVTIDGEKVGRIVAGSVLERTALEISVDLVPADLEFGLVVLLTFMYRLYADESALVGSLFDL